MRLNVIKVKDGSGQGIGGYYNAQARDKYRKDWKTSLWT
jgi:hypothetical protein